MKKTGKILVRAVWLVFMSAVALIMLFPLIYSVLGGFNTKTEFTSLSRILPIPTKWVMSNYIFAFSTSAIKPLINTFMRTAWYTVIVLVMSTLVGYVMARYEFRFKKTFFAIIIAAQVIPSVLTLIPTFVMVSNIPLVGGNNILGQGGQGLYNNQLMLYLPLSWGYLLWVFLFMQSMKSLPIAFEEAAELVRKVEIASPAEGQLIGLGQVKDETLASGILGKGAAVVPASGSVVSPVNGRVLSVFPTRHAVGIVDENGVELLIHIGIDTVKLEGKYFTAHVKEGDMVKIGDLLVEFDPKAVMAEGYDTTITLLITNSQEFLDVLPAKAGPIKAGQTILTVV